MQLRERMDQLVFPRHVAGILEFYDANARSSICTIFYLVYWLWGQNSSLIQIHTLKSDLANQVQWIGKDASEELELIRYRERDTLSFHLKNKYRQLMRYPAASELAEPHSLFAAQLGNVSL